MISPAPCALRSVLVRAQHTLVVAAPVRAFGTGACAIAAHARPMKSRSSFIATVQPRPASRGVTDSSMSWPYRLIPASSRKVSRAPRPHGATPALSRSRHSSTACTAGRIDLESVLARVAGSSDEELADLSALEHGERVTARSRLRPRLPDAGARLGPLNGDHGEIAPRLQRPDRAQADRAAPESRPDPCRRSPR